MSRGDRIMKFSLTIGIQNFKIALLVVDSLITLKLCFMIHFPFFFTYLGIKPTKCAFVLGGHFSWTKLKSVFKFKRNDNLCLKNYTKAKLYSLKTINTKIICVKDNIGQIN